MRISLSDGWDETRTILGRDGKLYAALALAMLVLPGIVLDLSLPTIAPGEVPRPGAWLAIGFAAIAVSLAGQLALIRLALGPATSVGEAIRHGFRRLPAYFGALLLWTLPLILAAGLLFETMQASGDHPRGTTSIGLMLWIIVAAFIAVRLVLSSAVASAEHAGPIAILARAWRASRGNWWRLFAFVVLFGVVMLVLLGAVQSVLGVAIAAAFGDLGPWTVGTLLLAIVGQLISACASVVFFVMLARLYRQATAGADVAGVPSSGT